MFEGCKGCEIHVDASVSPIDLVNTTKTKVFCYKSIPFVNFEKSSDCKLHLFNATKNCTVSTTGSSTISLKYPKEGKADDSEVDEDWTSFSIPEIYETKIKAGDKG